MKTKEWQALARIADMKFRIKAHAAQSLRSREAALQQRKHHLQDMNDRALEALRAESTPHLNSGDVLWQAWVGKNTASLNVEGARLRAEREIVLPDLRRSFARKQVCQQIADDLVSKAT